MGFNLDKLAAIAKPRSEDARIRAALRQKNNEWLRISQEIALCIHYYIRKEKMSQKCFADKLGVSEAYIGKLLKGRENLTLESICRIQQALGVELISISRPYEYSQIVTFQRIHETNNYVTSSTYAGIKSPVKEYDPLTGDAA